MSHLAASAYLKSKHLVFYLNLILDNLIGMSFTVLQNTEGDLTGSQLRSNKGSMPWSMTLCSSIHQLKDSQEGLMPFCCCRRSWKCCQSFRMSRYNLGCGGHNSEGPWFLMTTLVWIYRSLLLQHFTQSTHTSLSGVSCTRRMGFGE